jgi:hypothetical protein
MSNRKITANGPRSSILRVGSTHESTHHLPRLFETFNDRDQRGTLGYELDQLVVVSLPLVFEVVALGRREIDRAQISRDDTELLRFQATQNLADETALDAVGLYDEERSIHDEAI